MPCLRKSSHPIRATSAKLHFFEISIPLSATAKCSPAHPERTSVPRPLIPIRLSHAQRFVDVRALVDSGADDCRFPLEVAQILRLTLGGEHRYGGVGQGVITARFAT